MTAILEERKMNPHQMAFAIAEWLKIKENLALEHPDITDLTDTIDGEAQAGDLIVRLARGARDDEAFGQAVAGMISDMQIRRERFDNRAKAQRLAAQRLLEAIGEHKIERPDITISLRSTPRRVDVPDDSAVPDEYIITTRRPDKIKIREAFDEGKELNWAILTQPGKTLSIKTK